MWRGAVLDACVIYPITVIDSLLTLAEAGFYTPLWTDRILGEVERNLIERGFAAEAVRRRISCMNEAFPEARVEGFEDLEAGMTNDPEDRHVLAAAVRAGAALIVTFNLNDFHPEACRPHGVEAVSPDTLFSDFLLESPDVLIEALREQADRYDNPRPTFPELLEHLDRHTPSFVRDVRDITHTWS